MQDVQEREAVADQIDGCHLKLNYVQDQITEIQTAIVDMDGSKVSALILVLFQVFRELRFFAFGRLYTPLRYKSFVVHLLFISTCFVGALDEQVVVVERNVLV